MAAPYCGVNLQRRLNSSTMADSVFEYLKVCHVNCQSLLAHFDEFCLFFSASNYHVICLSETWLKPMVPDHMVELHGYRLFRCDRTGKSGGGVAFYLSNALNARILCQSEGEYCGKPEYLIAEICFDSNSKLVLAVVYRPPHCGYLEGFFNVFLDVSSIYKHSIIFGDFNADLKTVSYDSTQILSFVESSSLFLVPYGPTHHLQNSSTVLDLCIIDDEDKLISFDQHDACFLSSHDLISITYKINLVRHPSRTIRVRDFRFFDVDGFRDELSQCDWNSLFGAITVNDKVDILNCFLLDCFDRHAPFRDIRPKHFPAPWLTDDIRTMMRDRDRARRRWMRWRNAENHAAFKLLRNRAQEAVRAAKRNFYYKAFNNSSDPNAIWKKLRNLGLIKSSTTNQRLIFTTEDLNDFFLNSLGDEDLSILNSIYLGDVEYDDAKFYWKNIGDNN